MSLLPHQEVSAAHLVACVQRWGAAVDASDTGTGKTYTACEVLRRLGVGPHTVVVAPKAVLTHWQRAAAALGVSVGWVVNYERARRGGPWGNWVTGTARKRWRWHPSVRFVVFDEAHRCKNSRTQNACLLRATRAQRIPTLLLSATLASSPLDLGAIGYVLRLHDGAEMPTLAHPHPLSYRTWLLRHGCRPGRWAWMEWTEDEAEQRRIMAQIHEAVFPARGVRVRLEEVAVLPESRVMADLIDVDVTAAARVHEEMACELAALRQRAMTDRGTVLGRLVRLRQQAELLKVPALIELVQDGLASGCAVVVFATYRATLMALAARLGVSEIVDGSQQGVSGAQQRQAMIDRFQRGDISLLLVQLDTGGVGISLHDERGDRPRLSLICPGWSALALRQCLGRVHRVGARSPSVQRLLFAAGTVEEQVWARVRARLACLDALQDADLIPWEIPGEEGAS